jgi:hypothetical protein
MNSQIQIRILAAVNACLLPIARLLLRTGITYRQFDSVAKHAFVREATASAEGRGRPANTSRIAVMTGLSRKEVRRIRDELVHDAHRHELVGSDHSGPPSRVLHAWHTDRRFVNEDGSPKVLEFQDESQGFSALVRYVAGDVPPGAVRSELKRCGAVIEAPDGTLRVVKRYYVPGDIDEKAITTISGMLFPMAAGIAHNTNPDRDTEGFIQRFAFSESLSGPTRAAFRLWSRAEATRFIESIDDWLATYESAESEVGAPEINDRKRTAGIGVFYYEGLSAEQSLLPCDESQRDGS